MFTVRTLAGGLLAVSALTVNAQSAAPGYTIEGESSLLAGQKIYLLPQGNLLPAPKGAVLDSAQADASGRFRLHGTVAVPSVYSLRVGHQKGATPVALDNQTVLHPPTRQQKINGADVLLLSPGTSPAQDLLEKSMRYFMLSYKEVPADDKQLAQLKALLEANQASYLTPYLAYKYLRQQPCRGWSSCTPARPTCRCCATASAASRR